MLENNLDKPPLFSVGEEVVLQSVEYPQLNGDCVVVSVRKTPNKAQGCGYLTTIKAPSRIGNPQGAHWDQSALRKKHKPSEHSFDSLIEELKSKESRNAKA